MYVIFDDGAKGVFLGGGWKLDCSDIPYLNDILIVNDLFVNLISIINYVTKIYMSTSIELNAQS